MRQPNVACKIALKCVESVLLRCLILPHEYTYLQLLTHHIRKELCSGIDAIGAIGRPSQSSVNSDDGDIDA
jgi:hypothetical protein